MNFTRAQNRHAFRCDLGTSKTPSGASLRRYGIETGRLIQPAQIEGKHVFNDLALSSAGFVYISDTSERSVYEFNVWKKHIAKNGLGTPIHCGEWNRHLSGRKDAVCIGLGRGIDVIDLRSGSVSPFCIRIISTWHLSTASMRPREPDCDSKWPNAASHRPVQTQQERSGDCGDDYP